MNSGVKSLPFCAESLQVKHCAAYAEKVVTGSSHSSLRLSGKPHAHLFSYVCFASRCQLDRVQQQHQHQDDHNRGPGQQGRAAAWQLVARYGDGCFDSCTGAHAVGCCPALLPLLAAALPQDAVAMHMLATVSRATNASGHLLIHLASAPASCLCLQFENSNDVGE